MTDTSQQPLKVPKANPSKPKKTHAVKGGTGDANRLAVVILEVLAGVHTPTEAAGQLGISLPRYYQLETRALEGLVSACEPRRIGKQPSVEGQLARLQRELQQAQRECLRQQALVRAARRSVGLKLEAAPATGQKNKPDRRRKQRRPTVRALKAAHALRENIRKVDGQTVQQEQPSTAAPTERSRENNSA